MGKFLITEEEKSKILGMYYKTMGKLLVKEDQSADFVAAGINQMTASEDGGDMSVQIIDTNNRRIYYTCMTDPRLTKKELDASPYNYARSIYNDSFKDMKGQTDLKGNWEKIVQKYCTASYKFVNSWRDQNCPKLSEKTHWNYANECKTYIANKPEAQVAAATTSVDTPTSTDTTAASYKLPQMFKTTPYSPMAEYKKYIASGNLDPKQNADGSYTIIKDLNVNRPDRPGGIYKVGQTIKFTN